MTRTRLCQNLRNLLIPLWLFVLSPIAHAQTLMPMPAASPSASQEEETIVPTFETQKLARTFMLDIPAPPGQITDRNGGTRRARTDVQRHADREERRIQTDLRQGRPKNIRETGYPTGARIQRGDHS